MTADNSGRTVKVVLQAEVDDYVKAMDRAREATSRLAAALREVGISEGDMPAAIKTVLRFVRDDEDGDPVAAAV